MTQEAQQGPRAGRSLATVALVLAIAGLLLAFVPGLGFLLGAAAIGAGSSARRRLSPDGAGRGRATSSLGLGICAALLGCGFTVAYAACTPSVESAGEQQEWLEFDRAFEPGAALPAVEGDPRAPPADGGVPESSVKLQQFRDDVPGMRPFRVPCRRESGRSIRQRRRFPGDCPDGRP